MMLPSHLLATLIGCALLGLIRPIGPKGWVLALSFGVAIDLDHFLQFPAYVASHGWSGLTPASMLQWGASWQGFFHTPWALVLVVPACLAFWSVAPLAFWGLHMVQDFVIARHFVRFGSALEWAIDLVLLVTFAWLVVRDHRQHGVGLGLRQHLRARIGAVFPR